MRAPSVKPMSLLAGSLATPLSILGLMRLARERKLSRLAHALDVAPRQERFSEALVADLPEVAQRYFRHAIQPDTPLAGAVRMKIAGASRAKPGLPPTMFREHRSITPGRGGLWRLHIATQPVAKTAYAYYLDGAAREYSDYLGFVPIRMLYVPLHMAKLFLGRVMFESIFVPSALLPQRNTVWEQLDDEHARVTIEVDGERMPLDLHIDADGRLQEVRFPWWNIKNTGGKWRYTPCGLTIQAEQRFGGYTIPSHYTLMFWYKSDEQDPTLTLEYTIQEAVFL